MPQIGIITGLKTEEQALAPVMGYADAPYVRLSGARRARAIAGVEALIALGVDGILSFGSAGAASPDVKPGDLLVAGSVIDPSGIEHATSKPWTDALSQTLGVNPVKIAGVDEIADASVKSRLYATHGVSGIDMESDILASLAGRAKMPFAVLRAIVDPVEFTMPDYVFDTVRPDGSVSLLPVVAGLCLQPMSLGRLLDLNRYNKLAMGALSGAVRTLGPGFGFFTL